MAEILRFLCVITSLEGGDGERRLRLCSERYM